MMYVQVLRLYLYQVLIEGGGTVCAVEARDTNVLYYWYHYHYDTAHNDNDKQYNTHGIQVGTIR
jgi:hypothetical protein